MRRLLASELAQAKYVTPEFNQYVHMKYEKLASVVRVLQNKRNLVISRCCEEDGKEMYKEL